jgi:hypothetical protein
MQKLTPVEIDRLKNLSENFQYLIKAKAESTDLELLRD